MYKRLFAYIITFVIIMQSIFAFAGVVDMDVDSHFFDDGSISIHYGITQDKEIKVIEDVGEYKKIHEYYAWWQGTCKHVAHDEWREYKLYPDGRKEWQGDMICYNEEPEDSYDKGRHSWLMDGYQEQAVPPSPLYKAPTTQEDGYQWESKNCEYKSGFWGNLVPCGAVGWKKVIITKLKAGQTPSPTPSAATPTPTAMPTASPTPTPDPNPYAVINVSGKLKESRCVILDSSSSESHYPISKEKTTWTITPVQGTGASGNIFVVTGLGDKEINGTIQKAPMGHNLRDGETIEGVERQKLSFRKAGSYDITLYIENSTGRSDTATIRISIQVDLNPVCQISVPRTFIRDKKDSTGKAYATITVTDLSYSPDGDKIVKRIWYYRYDSDNDGDFNDEQWQLLDDCNKTEIALDNITNVGKYQFTLSVEEGFTYEEGGFLD